VSFTGEEVLNMIIHSHMLLAEALERLGLEPMAVQAEHLDATLTDDPALRWFFDHLASAMRDPAPVSLRVIKGGVSED
jgi:hypothetical protein